MYVENLTLHAQQSMWILNANDCLLFTDEEKLTVDSCLCDACFRHVDRRANCPSYKKRLSEPSKNSEANASAHDAEEKEPEGILFQNNKEVTFCQVYDCKEQASHSVCRKWALKVRKTLSKHIQLNFDNTASMAFLPICDKHYEDINHMLICMLCNRRLKRNHSYFLSQVNKCIQLFNFGGRAMCNV